MEKFKVRFSYQDMVLEVEGAREDIPLITQTLGERFKSLVGTAFTGVNPAAVNSAVVIPNAAPAEISAPIQIAEKEKSAKRPGRKKGTKIIEKDGKRVVVDASQVQTIQKVSPSQPSRKTKNEAIVSNVETEKAKKPRKTRIKAEVEAPQKIKVEKISKRAEKNKEVTPIAEVKQAEPPKPEAINTEAIKEPLIINWEKHDRTKFGYPDSSWDKSDMVLWFLYAAPLHTSFETLSLKQIVASINANYKPTRRLRDETAFKELSSFKRGKNIYVKESPIGRYSITDAGKEYVKEFISQKLEAATESEVW